MSSLSGGQKQRILVAEDAAVVYASLPLFGRRNDFLVPDIFAEDEQHVFGFVLVSQIEIFFHAIERKPLHAGVEVHQAERHAQLRAHRQPGGGARVTLQTN